MAESGQPKFPAASDPATPSRDAGTLSASNVPLHTRTQTCCGFTVRALVSKKKMRFVGEGVDLDLSYITDQLIAMGYPSFGLEACYRNPSDVVRAFLERRHAAHYRLWNLCSEREYTNLGFKAEIERFAWDDHTPPPLALLRPACDSVASWLAADADNVAVIHCKAGKGRTGLMIASFLVHCGASTSADAALALFARRRTFDGKGVTIPSQQRYVRYYALQIAARRRFEAAATAAPGATPVTPAAPQTPAPGGVQFGARALVLRDANEPVGSGAGVHILVVDVSRDSERKLGFDLKVAARADLGAASAGSGLAATPKSPKAASAVFVRELHRYSREAEARSETGAVALPDPVGAGAASAVPVPVRLVLRPGDIVLSINGVDVSCRSQEEVGSIVRSATDPVRIVVERPAGGSSCGGGLLRATSSHGWLVAPQPAPTAAVYLDRVAGGVGPWAASADPARVPRPTVELESFAIVDAPATLPADSGGCCAPSAGAAVDARDLYVMVWGGPGCATLVSDSRTWGGAVSSARPRTSATVAPGSSAAPAVAPDTGGAADSPPASGTLSVLEWALGGAPSIAAPAGGAEGLEGPDASSHPVHETVVQGDFRVCLMLPGHKKPVAAWWLHTACLPVPAAAGAALQQPAVASVRLDAQVAHCGLSPHAVTLQVADSTPAASVPADGRPDFAAPASAAVRDDERDSGSLLASVPDSAAATPVAAVPVESAAAPTVVAQSEDAGVSEARPQLAVPETTSEPPAPRPLPRAPVRILHGDVPGSFMTGDVTGMPALGACFSATPLSVQVAEPGSVASELRARAAEGTISFSKRDTDRVCKDRKHEVWPVDVTFSLRFRVRGLPEVYYEAVCVVAPAVAAVLSEAPVAATTDREAE